MFQDFVSWYETSDLKPYEPVFDFYVNMLSGHFFDTLERPPLHFSLSSVGYEPVEYHLKKLGYPPKPRHRTVKDYSFLYTGFETEARMLALLQAYGYSVEDTQKEVEWLGIRGHIDAVVDGVLIDVKAVNNGNFNRALSDNNPYINPVYLYQIAAYQKAMNKEKAALLYYNRDTSEIAFHEINDIDLTPVSDYLTTTAYKSLDDILKDELTLIPTPLPEVYKKVPTGNYLLPPSMRYSGYVDALYLTREDANGYGKPTTYVVDYRTHQETKEILESWKRLS